MDGIANRMRYAISLSDKGQLCQQRPLNFELIMEDYQKPTKAPWTSKDLIHHYRPHRWISWVVLILVVSFVYYLPVGGFYLENRIEKRVLGLLH